MSLTPAAKNAAANAIVVDQISLHSADPTIAGNANEVTGGAFPRKAIAFGAAVNGVRTQSGNVTVDIPASTIHWYVLWGGGVAQKVGQFTEAEVYAAQGQHVVKDGTITITG